MRIYVATSNAGKRREFRNLLGPLGFEVVEPPAYDAPDEGEASYEENAARKARALYSRLAAEAGEARVVADDSGLEIEALGGEPGVLTARFGGEHLSWAQRRHFVLERMRGIPAERRGARFVCAVHYIGADGDERSSVGSVAGTIAEEERGEGGFSFDPIFYYPPFGRTFAQLREEEKDRISHRALAVNGVFGVRADA